MAESSNVSSQESFSNYRNSDRGDQEQQQQQQQRQFQPHQQNVNERDRPTEIPAAKVSRTLASRTYLVEATGQMTRVFVVLVSF